MEEHGSEGQRNAGEFLAGIVLVGFSIFVIVESLRMPQRGPIPYVLSPGFLPLLLGFILFLLSTFVLSEGIRGGGHRKLGMWLGDISKHEEFWRWLIILLMTGGYTFVLGKIPFWMATVAYFLAIFIYLRIGGPARIAMYALGFSLFVSYVLPKLFEMPLP
ncbi:MAG: tripartite tricarboxylate transporter TctB family protein [Armatimonadota bacterium]|nr:tripartite tricarboxylate transporter TctB family protein [Armatimonadota bacterium]